MRKFACSFTALILSACGPSNQGQQGANGNTDNTDTSAPKAAASSLPSTFFIHCVGHDVRFRNYRPTVSLDFKVELSDPVTIKKRNSASKNYHDMCVKGDTKCNLNVYDQKILIASINRQTDEIIISTFVDIDRITGKFSGSEFTTVKNKEYTQFAAVGACKRDMSPEPPSEI